MRHSGRIVLRGSPEVPPCVIGVAENDFAIIGVSILTCSCVKTIRECIAQGADKTFQFVDAPTVSYSGATEITFDVWQTNVNGVSLLSKSLTGGAISLISENTFQLSITDTESQAMPAGRHYCEVWVTTSSAEKRLVGSGVFEVRDTRKFD